MARNLFEIKSISALWKQFALVSIALSVIGCETINRQENITEEEHAEILDATNELGSPAKDAKTIATKLGKIKGSTLSDPKGHELIKRTFLTKDPKKVEALITKSGAMKSDAPSPWEPICSGTTTMMDLLLDNVIGDNDQSNSRIFGKSNRDSWRELTDKFVKVMMSHHDKLTSVQSRDGNPILRHYMVRTIRGNWRRTTDQLIDIWGKNPNSTGDEALIGLLAEESRKNSRDKKAWGNVALKLVGKCGKESSFSSNASNHRALVIFIEDDWSYPNVCGELVKQFGTHSIPAEVKHIYLEMLPRMIEKRDAKTYATSFDYIIAGSGELSLNSKNLAAAIEAKRHDLLMKILHHAKDTDMQTVVNSKYKDAKNLIALYAQPKYYPGKANFEGFLNLLKEKMGTSAFKSSLSIAHSQGRDLKFTQEVLDIIYHKGL